MITQKCLHKAFCDMIWHNTVSIRVLGFSPMLNIFLLFVHLMMSCGGKWELYCPVLCKQEKNRKKFNLISSIPLGTFSLFSSCSVRIPLRSQCCCDWAVYADSCKNPSEELYSLYRAGPNEAVDVSRPLCQWDLHYLPINFFGPYGFFLGRRGLYVWDKNEWPANFTAFFNPFPPSLRHPAALIKPRLQVLLCLGVPCCFTYQWGLYMNF